MFSIKTQTNFTEKILMNLTFFKIVYIVIIKRTYIQMNKQII